MVRLQDSWPEIKKGLKAQGKRLASYRSTIPAGRSGKWSVRKIKVKLDLENLRMIRDGRGCAPGEFTQLYCDGRGTVMSDTDAEIEDMRDFIDVATGRIFVCGLGLGCLVQNLLRKEPVEYITVVEISPDVISLVAPHITSDRLAIVEGDAFRHVISKGTRYDFAWYDIWDNICSDNLKEAAELRRRFRGKVGKSFVWAENEMRHPRY